MYSCNWTVLDIKSKQLLLMAMHMNNANKCGIQFSPTRIVNIELLANVIILRLKITCINKNKLYKVFIIKILISGSKDIF